jgi:hypothetical protein
MKIASIGMQTRGGAGLSSLKLHQQFLNMGHESKFFVAHHTLHEELVTKIATKKRNKNDWWTLGTIPLKDGVENLFSSGLSGLDEEYLESIYQWADIILLRWVTATISDYQISRWANREKPIFWCLSDMAPMTGGCHYSSGCDKYESDCNDCHMVSTAFKDNPAMILKRRVNLWRNIHVVSPSNWLAECSKNSKVFRDKEISVIQTGVELNIFQPSNKHQIRNELGLPLNKRIFFFGADSAVDDRKGYKLLISALKKLSEIVDDKDNYHLLVVGHGSMEEEELSFSYTQMGNINSRSKLAQIYSAADLTVLPYKEDNLPNVMLESISCGTPVVAFNIGGMPDVIKEGVNGRLAIPFDTHDMANQILLQLNDDICQSDIRNWAEQNIDVKNQASKYINLFNKYLGE